MKPNRPDNITVVENPNPIAKWLIGHPRFDHRDDVTISLSITLPVWQWLYMVQGAAQRRETLDEIASTCLLQGWDPAEWYGDDYKIEGEDEPGKDGAA